MTANPLAYFYDVGGTGRQVKLRVTPRVTQMTWGEGGAISATVNVDAASDMDIWQYVELLRSRCEIMDKMDKVWLGYVKTVKVTLSNGLSITISLDKMYNSTRILYSQTQPGDTGPGEPTWSTWWQNDESVNYYGLKMLTPRISEASYQQMANYRSRLLSEFALPLVTLDLSRVGTAVTPSAVITAEGWWQTLGWRMYGCNTGSVSYTDMENKFQNVGNASASTKITQGWKQTSAVDWLADQVKINVKKIGSPADNLIVDLCADSSGSPGSILATVSMAGSALSADGNSDWITLSMSTRVTITPSVNYWLVISRSGSVSASDYYSVAVNEALGYADGAFKVYNGSAWVARSPDADLAFEVLGSWETTRSIKDVVVSTGQFLLGDKCVLETDSGIYANPYRDGTQNGLQIVRELLKSGGTGNRRLRANIRDDRVVYIDIEPAAGTNDYTMKSDGLIVDRWNAPQLYPPYQCWLRVGDLLPLNISTALIADPSRAYIEEATWSAGDKFKFKLRGAEIFVT